MQKVSLQINVSPGDYNFCVKLLERQIIFWYEELDEIVISIESLKSKGRFGVNFEENKIALISLIELLAGKYGKIRFHFIDYSNEKSLIISKKYLGNSSVMPKKDYRGGPFYCYFDGIEECTNRYVIHIDSDMIIGGDRNSWIQDSVRILMENPHVLIINPFPGPPNKDFKINQKYISRINNNYVFNSMSTRIFLVDKEKLAFNKISLKPIKKSLKNLKWFFKNKFSWNYQLPEIIISDMMKANNLVRIDTPGNDNSKVCYTIHPLVKPPIFIDNLPKLLNRIDNFDIPEIQFGQYNLETDFMTLQR